MDNDIRFGKSISTHFMISSDFQASMDEIFLDIENAFAFERAH